MISGLAGFLAAILPQKGKNVQKFGIAVILGGAVSNLYDRMIRHYVVDYFSIQCGKLKKVVFNLGDIFVFLGSGILFGALNAGGVKMQLLAKVPSASIYMIQGMIIIFAVSRELFIWFGRTGKSLIPGKSHNATGGTSNG